MKSLTLLLKYTAATVFSGLLLQSCGSKEDSKDDPTIYSTITVSNSTTTNDNGTINLTNVETCSLNEESDFFKMVLTSGQGRLIVKVQDASTSTFNCVQEENGFDNCFVYGEAVSSQGSSTLNGYSMAKDTDSNTLEASFNYQGTCSVTLTSLITNVQGELSCSEMVQTKLNGTARNPIQDDVTADISTDNFYCPPQ